MPEALRLVRARAEDAELLRALQEQAFSELLRTYGDHGRSPAEETVEQVRAHITAPGSCYYLLMVGDEPVGGIRVIDPGDGGTKRIAPLFLLPEHRRKGFGSRAVREVERLHGETGWQLNTILQEEGNCRFYEALGYRRMTTRLRINERTDIIFYAK